MGRGLGSKGAGSKGGGGGPEWLNPEGYSSAGTALEPQQEEAPRKRKKGKGGGDDDFDLEAPAKKGIQWKPLAFLIMMTLPGLAPLVIGLIDRLQTMGIPLPGQGIFSPNPYQPCLQAFYADWAPEKLGSLDRTLEDYKGREKQLFARLAKKYGKPNNVGACIPKKA